MSDNSNTTNRIGSINLGNLYSTLLRVFSFTEKYDEKKLKMTPEPYGTQRDFTKIVHTEQLFTDHANIMNCNENNDKDVVIEEILHSDALPQKNTASSVNQQTKAPSKSKKMKVKTGTETNNDNTQTQKSSNFLKKIVIPAATIAMFLSGQQHQDFNGMKQMHQFDQYEHGYDNQEPPLFRDALFQPHIASMVLHELESSADDEEDEKISYLFSNVHRSLKSSFFGIERISDCTGGVYLLPGGGIFKPMDEEVCGYDRNDGKDRKLLAIGCDHPQRAGFLIGEGASREVAAYLIDRANGGFSGVPTTCLVSLDRKLIYPNSLPGSKMKGSLQQLIPHESSSEDYGGSVFRIRDVERIALLDLRLFNTDRHGGNMLVTNDKSLVPIDHGLCLPDVRELGEAWFEWLQWEQCKSVLSEEAMEWLQSINVEKDAAILRRLNIRPEAVMTLYVMTYLLQRAALKGWTLYQIGMFVQRPSFDVDSRSRLEQLIEKVVNSSENLSSAWHSCPVRVQDEFLNAYKKELDRCLDTEDVSFAKDNGSEIDIIEIK